MTHTWAVTDFAYAAGSFGEQALAQVRDELAGYGSGQETILTRRRYIMHPLGFTNQVAPTNGVSQTNAELGTDLTPEPRCCSQGNPARGYAYQRLIPFLAKEEARLATAGLRHGWA